MSAGEDRISECFEDLETAVKDMNEWWKSSLVACNVYRLPILTDIGVPQRLAVEHVNGTHAIDEAADAYAQFGFHEDQDARTAFRLPGLIFVSSSETSVAARVNEIKSELQTLIAQLFPDSNKRLRYCKSVFPKMSMGQAYRHIVLPDEGLSSVSFTWSPATVGTTRLTVNEACALLDGNIAQEDSLGNSARVSALTLAKANVSKLGDSTPILKRKPVPPHPRANLVYKTGKPKMVHSNLPFIVSGNPVDVKHAALRDFDSNARRPLRSDKLMLVCLHEGLSLFIEQRA